MINTGKVVITGAKGRIGTVLRKNLHGYLLVNLDLPWHNLKSYLVTKRCLDGAESVIHLAWNLETDNLNKVHCDPWNTRMFMNIFRAAVELRIPRLIMASSVHADNFMGWKGPGLMSPSTVAEPVSKYGSHKLFMEMLGKNYAEQHMIDVICIRFGWVNRENDLSRAWCKFDPSIFLAHEDCASLINAILNSKIEPGRFVSMYAVSNNDGNIHNTANPFGWRPALRNGVDRI